MGQFFIKSLVVLIHFFFVISGFFLLRENSAPRCRSPNPSEDYCLSDWSSNCQGSFAVYREIQSYGETDKISKTCPWSLSTEVIGTISVVITFIFLVSFADTYANGNRIYLTVALTGLCIPCLVITFVWMLKDIVIGSRHYGDHVDANYKYNPLSFVLNLFPVLYWIFMTTWAVRVVLKLSEKKLQVLRWLFRVHPYNKFDFCPKRFRRTKSPIIQIQPRLPSQNLTQATLQDQSSASLSVSVDITAMMPENMRGNTGLNRGETVDSRLTGGNMNISIENFRADTLGARNVSETVRSI